MAHHVILSGATGHYGRALAAALVALPVGHPVRPTALALIGRSRPHLAAAAAAAAAADVAAAGQPVRVTSHEVFLARSDAALVAQIAAAAVSGLHRPMILTAETEAAAATGGVPPPPPARVTLITAAGALAVPAAVSPLRDPLAEAVTTSVGDNAVAPLRLATAVATAIDQLAGAAAAAAAARGESPAPPPPPPSLTVVAVSSLLAMEPTPVASLLPYAVGKAAAEAAFRCLAAQWAAAAGGGRTVLLWAPGPLSGGGMRDALRAAGVDDGLPRSAEVTAAASAAALMDVLRWGGWVSGDHIDYFDVAGEQPGGDGAGGGHAEG